MTNMDLTRTDDELAAPASQAIDQLGVDRTLIVEISRLRLRLHRNPLATAYTILVGESKREDATPRERECRRALADALLTEVVSRDDSYDLTLSDTPTVEELVRALLQRPTAFQLNGDLLTIRYSELLKWWHKLTDGQA